MTLTHIKISKTLNSTGLNVRQFSTRLETKWKLVGKLECDKLELDVEQTEDIVVM